MEDKMSNNHEKEKEVYEILHNADAPLTERWEVAIRVEADIKFRMLKLQEIASRLEEAKKQLQQAALQQFKETRIAEFMEKYNVEIDLKKYNKEMLKDFTMLEEMEVRGCYHFKGVTVVKKDCNLCRRHCRVHDYQ